MRRKDREITDLKELLEVMEECDVCRLAFSDGDYPYILPLNYGVKEENGEVTLYFHGAMEGRKYELIEKVKKASFEMDCGHRLIISEEDQNCAMEYRSVIGRGQMEMLPEEKKKEALEILMKHYRKEPFPINPEAMKITKVFCLKVESMTGKRRTKKGHAVSRTAKQS